jgi:hypothetical protein
MLQRKQTVWLFIAAMAILCTFFIPYGIHTESKVDSTIITETDLNAQSNYVLMSLTIASALFSFFLIFLYGNRKLQMGLCLLNVVLAMSILLYELYFTMTTLLPNRLVVGILGTKIYVGVFIPVVSAFFLMMAYIGIRKDEKIIRDSNRLR